MNEFLLPQDVKTLYYESPTDTRRTFGDWLETNFDIPTLETFLTLSKKQQVEFYEMYLAWYISLQMEPSIYPRFPQE
ncbi:hypothetical protein KJ628_03485 [Patescibacteria group bacterium]|nr:hypothetical protein [Patescibacteria group bacterium]